MRTTGLLVLALFLTGCAGIDFTPTGGPKDTQPPQPMSIHPAQGSTMVRTDQVRVSFDEYIQVAPGTDDLLISPPPPDPPTVKVRLKELVLRWDEELPPNTTYQIRLDGYVRDFTEDNPVQDLLLVFSTGPVIDSARITAPVAPAALEPLPESMTALLFDTAVALDTLFGARPIYRAPVRDERIDLSYLRPGSYRLAVLHDANGNDRPDGTADHVGVRAEPVVVDTNSVLDALAIAPIDPPPPSLEVITRTDHLLVRADRAIRSFEMLHPSIDPSSITVNPHRDSIYASFPDASAIDTVVVSIAGSRDTIATASGSPITAWQLPADRVIAPDASIVLELPQRADTVRSKRISVRHPAGDSIPVRITTPASLPPRLVITPIDSIPIDSGTYVLALGDSALFDPNGSASSAGRMMFHVEHPQPSSSIVLTQSSDRPSTARIALFNATDRFLLSASLFDGMVLDNVPHGDYKLLIFNDLNNDQRWNGPTYPPYQAAEPVFLALPALTIRPNWQHEITIP